MSSLETKLPHSAVITIDGPAASGKSSVSRGVAEALGWNWVSTGAFYRGLGFVAQMERIDPEDVSELVKVCNSDIWEVKMSAGDTLVLYKNEDVTEKIKDEDVGRFASKVSPYPEVRSALLQAQRNCLEISEKGLVAEGRDCGTVVFPQAALKIFLTARDEDRAQRRAVEQGKDMQEVLKSQEKRDRQDSSRATAPLQVPEGAHVIDTSQLDLAGVIASVLKLVDEV